MTAAAPSRMIRASEVADRMGLAPKTVRELARRGQLPALRFGPRGHWLFDPAANRARLPRRCPLTRKPAWLLALLARRGLGIRCSHW